MAKLSARLTHERDRRPRYQALPCEDTYPGGHKPRDRERAYHRACSPGDELGAGHHRRRRDEAVHQPVDRVVGVVDAEVDRRLPGPDLVKDRLDLVGQAGDEMVPAAREISLACLAIRFGVEAFNHHLVDVWLEQFRNPHLGTYPAAQAPGDEQGPEQKSKIGRQDEFVLVEDLHAAAS